MESHPNCLITATIGLPPDAHVIGRVKLGSDVGVWFGAVIRGDNEPIVVGARTNIQEGATLHTDSGFPLTIGEGCTIGHQAIVHSCTLGDNVSGRNGCHHPERGEDWQQQPRRRQRTGHRRQGVPGGVADCRRPGAGRAGARCGRPSKSCANRRENYAANFKRFKAGCRKIAD